jgi:H+/gluconate symporter-like permease
MIGLVILAGVIAAAIAVVFAWPWIDPYLQRHDVPTRLLDRLEEEWEREDEPATPDWRW